MTKIEEIIQKVTNDLRLGYTHVEFTYDQLSESVQERNIICEQLKQLGYQLEFIPAATVHKPCVIISRE